MLFLMKPVSTSKSTLAVPRFREALLRTINSKGTHLHLDESPAFSKTKESFILRGRASSFGIGLVHTLQKSGVILSLANTFGKDGITIMADVLGGSKAYNNFESVDVMQTVPLEIAELRLIDAEEEVTRLREEIKKLREENKKLRGS